VGKALLDAAKDWARVRGATHLELDSAETRTDAHRFYEREGPSWRSVCFAWEL
jgi:GNAT superfamily N-acetyltransferase